MTTHSATLPLISRDNKATASDTHRPIVRRYAVAGLFMLIAFAIRYSLTPVLGEELPFMLFIAASLLAAWYGGAIPGIASLLLGLFLADHFFLARGNKPGMSEPSEVLYIVRYVFTASLGVLLIEIQHRNRRRLEREITLRKSSEEALTRAQAQLSRHAEELEKTVAERSKELAASVQFLRDLLYQIAHNLRAPLRAMQGFASILANKYSSSLDATARDYLAHISDASNRMDDLVHDVLQYGQLGHREARLENVSLEECVSNTLYLLAYEIEKKHATIAAVTPLPQVLADRELLNQVLINLIDNALKFAAPERPPQISIRSEIRGTTVRLFVEDNGIGIEPRHQQRIFGMFETLHPTSSSHGTGIGLALVKQSMRLMDGEAGVESTPGRGSRFWIELPLARNSSA